MKKFTPTYVFDSISDIDGDFLKREGISCVLLDIDNTLVPDNAPCPDARAEAFIELLKRKGIKPCLISNNKQSRVESFNAKLGLKAVHRAHKPLTRKMLRAVKELGAKKESVLFIGDQLLTDIYAGNRCGIRTCLVTPISLERENCFFKLKRFIEKKVLSRNFR
ncbi:MAG: YqeG family HAD IIIA-type phosphatase [Clostridia bacterium]|nr:YqeG family HAD IIIA-type phosphatase [Clostridia bacterium]